MGVEETEEAFRNALLLLSQKLPQQQLGKHMHSQWDEAEKYLTNVLAFDTAF